MNIEQIAACDDNGQLTTAFWFVDIGCTLEKYTIQIGPRSDGYFLYEVKKRGIWKNGEPQRGNEPGWYLYREDEDGEEIELCRVGTWGEYRMAAALFGLAVDGSAS